MKYLDQDDLNRLIVVSRLRGSKRARERQKKRSRLRLRVQGIEVRKKGAKPRRLRILHAPDRLDLADNATRTLQFIENIRRQALHLKRDVFCKMHDCEAIAPEAALILTAEIERCSTGRQHSINGNNPQKLAPRCLLRDIGFHTHLAFQEPKIAGSADDPRRFIRVRSGKGGQPWVLEQLQEVVLGDAAKLPEDRAIELLTGLHEAMLNVMDHAYREDVDVPDPILSGKWWVAGYRDNVKKEIAIMCYDQGAGIPATLGRTMPEIAKRVLATITGRSVDGELVAAAMDYGRTGTTLPGRGNGLPKLKTMIENSEGGELIIYSRRGKYSFSKDTGAVTSELAIEVPGTLIVWRLVNSPVVEWS